MQDITDGPRGTICCLWLRVDELGSATSKQINNVQRRQGPALDILINLGRYIHYTRVEAVRNIKELG